MKKKLLSLFIATALSLSCFTAVPIVSRAEEYSSGEFTYTTEGVTSNFYYSPDDECVITGYTGLDNNVIIPSILDGKTVVGIGESAFSGNENITSVVIPDTVKYIGIWAFSGCSGLTDIDLGNSVEYLDGWCFQFCNALVSIEIPASLTSENADVTEPFNFCDSLKTVTIASGGVKIPESLLYGCDALETVNIPEGIKEIEFRAFGRCPSLKEIKIPDSVQTIGNGVFYRCTSLKEIILPESDQITIGSAAFEECSSLEDFYDYNEHTQYLDASVFSYTPLTMHGYPGSNTEDYANENNIPFVPFTDEELDAVAKELAEDGKQMMCRYYNPNSGEHLYTSSATEKKNLVAAGWTPEGRAWIAPASSNTPVYRLYNPNSGEHHYTSNVSERDNLVSLGWNDEGIGWYSDDDQVTPLYRLYNPNATGQYEAGGHHYTKDTAERDRLIGLGWNDEGIGWYGV